MTLTHSENCDLGFDCLCEPGKILYDPAYQPKDVEELYGRWVPCDSCENMWCLAHGEHAHDCSCPSVERLEGLEDDVPLDGDHESALASAGFGTDEDYGYFGED